MFLSRIQLDMNKRATMVALSSPSIFHGAIESSFAGERPHCLWRVDKLNNKYYILVLSENIPDLTKFENQYGSANTTETCSYDKLLSNLKEGSKWQFRLRANPTYCASIKNGEKRGRLCAHTTVEKQCEWLIRKSEQYGFHIDSNDFSVISQQWYRFKKNRNLVSILAVTYEGVLNITDEERFLEIMKGGIGRGKAYGMGLMTLMRPTISE